jgi:hypothetical protein
MKRSVAVIVVLAMWALPAFAQQAQTFKAYPLNQEKTQDLLKAVTAVLAEYGNVIEGGGGGKILVVATPETHTRVAALLAEIDPPPHNIRIDFSVTGVGSQKSSGASITGTGGVIVKQDGTGYRIKVRPQVKNDLSSSSGSAAGQSVVVADGKQASLVIGHEVPFFDWLKDYGFRQGDFDREEIVRATGSWLRVEPKIIGNGRLISLTLTPEMVVRVKNGTTRLQFVSVSTHVTVADGATVHIGGLARDSEFYQKFLVGYDSAGNPRSTDMTVTATILNPDGRRAY